MKSLGQISKVHFFPILVRGLTLSLLLWLPACQTLDAPEHAVKEENLLESQKSLAISLLNAGNPNAAFKAMRPLVDAFPKDAEVQNLMGLTQLALKNTDRAVGYFTRAYKLDASTAIALNLSAALIDGKRYGEATKLVKRLIAKEESSPNYAYRERLYHNLGLIAERQNNLVEAEKNYRIALEENPTFYLSTLSLGRLYDRTKRTDLARVKFEQAHEICPTCYDAVDALSKHYISSNRGDLAVNVLLQFNKNESLSEMDRTKAAELLKSIRSARAPTPKPTNPNANPNNSAAPTPNPAPSQRY